MVLNFNKLLDPDKNTGTLLKTKETKILSINQTAFTSLAPATDNITRTTNQLTDNTGGINILIPIEFPQHSLIKNIIVTGNVAGASVWSLLASNLTSAGTFTLNNTAINVTKYYTQADGILIDNNSFTYSIKVVMNTAGDDLFGVRLEYEEGESR